MEMEINWIAVGAAGLSAFLLGGLWYGPLFGKAWQRNVGLSDEQVKNANMARTLGLSLVLSLIAAFVFHMFLGAAPELGFATAVGASAGLCWVAASLGIIYLFEQRTFALWAINGGYVTLQFTLYGLVLSLLG